MAMRISGPIADCYHVAFDLFSKPHARVEAIGDYIGHRVIDAHLEPDIGIGECQPCDGRVEHRCGGVLARRDADGPGRLLSQHIEMGEFRFDALKVWDDRAEQAFPSLGRRDAAGRTCQEPEAEPLLKAPHRVTQRGR